VKTHILTIIIAFTLLLSCENNKQVTIAIGTTYWEGKYSINKTYIDALRENGAHVRLIPCTEDESTLLADIQDVDGFVFIGGRDYFPHWYGKDMHPSMEVMHPHRALFDSLFMHLALQTDKPILGICAGEQLLNIVTGGKLFRDIPNHRSVTHIINTKNNSHIHSLFADSMLVNSWHHQCVDPNYLNSDFHVTAWSKDSIVECIEYKGKRWIMGTQFHPERLEKTQRDLLFSKFIQEARK
jgi:putative glutamine amidotransferase